MGALDAMARLAGDVAERLEAKVTPLRQAADVLRRAHADDDDASPEFEPDRATAFVDALNSAELKSRLATLMAEPAPSTPEAFAAFVRAEHAKYEKVVKASGAKAD